jgi:hypothetical protein
VGTRLQGLAADPDDDSSAHNVSRHGRDEAEVDEASTSCPGIWEDRWALLIFSEPCARARTRPNIEGTSEITSKVPKKSDEKEKEKLKAKAKGTATKKKEPVAITGTSFDARLASPPSVCMFMLTTSYQSFTQPVLSDEEDVIKNDVEHPIIVD